MKANELRIENWIYQGEQYGNARISSYQIYQMSLMGSGQNNSVSEYYKTFKPIPLTEEWLLKFGSKLNGNTVIKDFQLGDFSVTLIKDVFDFWIVDSIDASFSLEIKYVHQLQNLYFALTGEELTINEKSPTI